MSEADIFERVGRDARRNRVMTGMVVTVGLLLVGVTATIVAAGSIEAAEERKALVQIKGRFILGSKYTGNTYTVGNEYTVDFALNEKNGKHYLILSVAGGICSYHVKDLSDPRRTRGMYGGVWSNKAGDCIGISDKKTNELFNSFELMDLNYRLDEDGKIQGVAVLSSSTATWIAEIQQ